MVETQISAAGECKQCGACCHFKTFGHRLYATGLEVLYLITTEGPPKAEFGEDSCGYQDGALCGARGGRALGCRTFFCGGDMERMRAIHEEALQAIKAISDRHGLAWQYEALGVQMERVCGGKSPEVQSQ